MSRNWSNPLGNESNFAIQGNIDKGNIKTAVKRMNKAAMKLLSSQIHCNEPHPAFMAAVGWLRLTKTTGARKTLKQMAECPEAVFDEDAFENYKNEHESES